MALNWNCWAPKSSYISCQQSRQIFWARLDPVCNALWFVLLLFWTRSVCPWKWGWGDHTEDRYVFSGCFAASKIDEHCQLPLSKTIGDSLASWQLFMYSKWKTLYLIISQAGKRFRIYLMVEMFFSNSIYENFHFDSIKKSWLYKKLQYIIDQMSMNNFNSQLYNIYIGVFNSIKSFRTFCMSSIFVNWVFMYTRHLGKKY